MGLDACGWACARAGRIAAFTAAAACALASPASAQTVVHQLGSTTPGSISVSPGEGYKFGSIFQASEDGVSVAFRWYVRGGNAAQTFTPAVYAVSGSTPTSLLGVGAPVTVPAGQPAGWATSTLTGVTLQAGQSYLLALVSGPTSNGAYNYATSANGAGLYNQNPGTAPTSSWGSTNTENRRWTFVLDYQPGGGGGGGGSPPANTSPPTISGTPQENQTLTAGTGSWSGSPTGYAYRWRRCDTNGAGCTDIAAATAASYLLTGADVGATIRVAVTATNANGSTTAVSAPTATVTATPPSGGDLHQLGNPTPGSISASPGEGYKYGSIFQASEDGVSVAFRWYVRGGNAAQTFTPAVYAVSGSTPTSLLGVGAPVTVPAGQPAGWATSTLTGVTLQAGQSYLLALVSGPTSNGAYNYATSANGAGLYNQNPGTAPTSSWGSTNTENRRWTFVLDYQPGGGGGGGGSPPANTSPPTISGTPQENQTLTAGTGSWSGSPTGYAYRWRRCDTNGAGCTDIAAATAASYLLTGADVGATIRVAVTATNANGSTTAVSAPTATVTATPPSGGDLHQLGNPTPGSISASPGEGYKYGSIFQATENGVSVDFRFYTRGGNAAQTFAPAVYAVSGSTPTSLLGVGAPVTIPAGQPAGWATSTLTGVTLQAGQSYLLALVSGPTSNGAYNYATSANGAGLYNQNPGTAPTSSWGSTNTENRRWTFVLDYQPGGGGEPPPPPPPPPMPQAMAALGDSLTRAYGATGSPSDAPSESWSTGGDAAVASHYRRLLPLSPELSGHAYNLAISGSKMASTTTQAAGAVSRDADYVTVWAGTNDVCTSTVAGMTSVANFRSQLQATLSALTSGLPGVRILVVSIPDWYGFWQANAGSATAEDAWAAWPDRCPDLLADDATAAERAAVRDRIDDLNAAAADVCAGVAGCFTDGGAVFALWPSLTAGDMAFDYFHLTPQGQAKVAAATWAATPWGGAT